MLAAGAILPLDRKRCSERNVCDLPAPLLTPRSSIVDDDATEVEPRLPVLPPPPIARHPSPVYTTVLPPFRASLHAPASSIVLAAGGTDCNEADAAEVEPCSPILLPPPIARHPSPVYAIVVPPFTAKKVDPTCQDEQQPSVPVSAVAGGQAPTDEAKSTVPEEVANGSSSDVAAASDADFIHVGDARERVMSWLFTHCTIDALRHVAGDERDDMRILASKVAYDIFPSV